MSAKVIVSVFLVLVAISGSEARWGGFGGWGGWGSNSWESYESSEEVVLPSTCANEVGLYYNGTTLSVTYVGSIAACCQNCQLDTACYSYSYRGDGRCWKVGPSTVRVYSQKYQSGMVRASTGATTNVINLTVPVTTVSPVTAAPVTVAPVTVATGCFIATNVNYNIASFNSTTATSYTDCCNKCGNTAGCISWTYSLLTGICFFKNRLPTAGETVSLTYSYSGLPTLFPTATTTVATTTIAPTTTTVATTTVATATTTRSYGCFVQSDVNYQGGDFQVVIVTSVGECCNLCGATTGCVVFSYNLANRVCSLKNSIPAVTGIVATVGTFSGVVTLK